MSKNQGRLLETGSWRSETNQSPISSLRSSLFGKRIVITRSRKQAAPFAEKLARLGAEPIVFPVIQFTALPTEPLDYALTHFEQYDWVIFTSANAVDFFFRRVDALGLSLAMPQVATTGSTTADRLRARQVTIDFTPGEFIGEALALGLGDLTGQRALLPRAKIGRPEIVDLLRRQGAVVDEVALYDTVTAVPAPESLAELEKGFDIITFTSPSSVRNFLKILEDVRPRRFGKPARSQLNQAIIACIGPVTAAAAEKQGLRVAVVPDEYTIDGLIQAMTNSQ